MQNLFILFENNLLKLTQLLLPRHILTNKNLRGKYSVILESIRSSFNLEVHVRIFHDWSMHNCSYYYNFSKFWGEHKLEIIFFG